MSCLYIRNVAEMTDNSSITIDITSLWHAWVAFRKRKKPSRAILVFEENLEENLMALCADLQSGIYEHGSYFHKILCEKKRRDIYVASVRDRVVHRLIYEYLAPIIDTTFDFDVWSCRKDKGLHKCLVRTQVLLTRHRTSYIWRGDIHKFFDSVPHHSLMKVIDEKVVCSKTKGLLQKVISSYTNPMFEPECVGVPIGNLTSQLLANMYLDQFDTYVRHTIKPLAYVRYGDDFILLCSGKSDVENAKTMGHERLGKLGLIVNSKQEEVVHCWQGLHFLGHIINKDGSVICGKTRNRMLNQLNTRNISSYSSLKIDNATKRSLAWLLDSDG